LEGHEVICAQDAYGDVSKALEGRFGEPRRTGLIWKAQNTKHPQSAGVGLRAHLLH
jgi:hypothetical protein